MVMGTHHGSVKHGTGADRLLGRAETSRRATTPRQQPPHGVGKRWRQSPSLTRQSPWAVALFLSKKGKQVRRQAAGLPRARRVSNASTNSRCNRLGSVVLTLDELRQITNIFSDDQLIGEGAFGKVYKGVLTNGDMIAVKRFASTIIGLQDVQYENEVQHLMRLKHPNIVQLVGYCSETEIKLVRHNGTFVQAEKSERLLCLEYMPKGSLRGHLSDETCGLEWNTRFKIIQGICYGLHYLHEEWQATPIIHMDLKPTNILLDDNMVPKIADFGLSRLFGEEQTRTFTTNCKGTPGYMAPEYLEKGVITKMFDIFSLGVIIIEIITGLKDYPTDETETTSQQYIDLILNNWRNRPAKAQGYTYQDIDYQQIKKCIQIGLLCVKSDPMKRPTVKQIVKMLERSDEAYQNEREDAFVLCRVTKRSDWALDNDNEVGNRNSHLERLDDATTSVICPEESNHAATPVGSAELSNDVAQETITPDSTSPNGGNELETWLEELLDPSPSFNLVADTGSADVSLTEQCAESSNLQDPGSVAPNIGPGHASPIQDGTDATDYLFTDDLLEDLYGMLYPGTDQFNDSTFLEQAGQEGITIRTRTPTAELQLDQENNKMNLSNGNIDTGNKSMVTSNSESINRTMKFTNNSGRRLEFRTDVEHQKKNTNIVISAKQSDAANPGGHSNQGNLKGFKRCSSAGFKAYIFVAIFVVGVAAAVLHYHLSGANL